MWGGLGKDRSSQQSIVLRFHISNNVHIYCSSSAMARCEQLPKGGGSTTTGGCVGSQNTVAMLCLISKHKLSHMENMIL